MQNVKASTVALAAASQFIDSDSVPDKFTEDDMTKHLAEALVNRPDIRKKGNIYDALRKDERFSKLVRILEENRGLRDDLENTNKKVTFFAPTNDAFHNIEEALSSVRESEGRRGGSGGEREDLEKVIRYHIVSNHEINLDCLYEGLLLESSLRWPQLGNKNQKIRVFRYQNDFYLNMYARIECQELRTENGVIHPINRVLCIPLSTPEMLGVVPVAFSTTLVALCKSGILKEVDEGKAITTFAPDNAAWKRLGIQNMFYLFSPKGQKDLKTIMQYHVGKELVYTCDVMKKHKVNIDTLLEGKQITFCGRKQHEKGGREGEDEECRQCSGSHEKPKEYLFSLNNGEAHVTLTDFISGNGVIQPINSVLVPDNVCLPFERGA